MTLWSAFLGFGLFWGVFGLGCVITNIENLKALGNDIDDLISMEASEDDINDSIAKLKKSLEDKHPRPQS